MYSEKANKKKEIYIVDVSSMFFRAFYAIRPLTSTKGVPVNAVYGFISMIVKLLKDKKPDHLVFCYDRKEPSFRKSLYDDYKANRSEMPEDLQVQMPYLKQVAELFGITALEVENYEADDLIATIAQQAEKNHYDAYIVSGDKDFSQVVTDHIFIYDTMKDIIYDPKLVKEKHGVTPEQFLDFQAITGDSVDNIPGVAGIGPKGAQKLIEQFGSLENIYENIDKIESKSIKEKLIQSKDRAFLSKKLARIVTDVKLPTTLKDYELKPFQKEQMREFFKELNFKSFEKSILGDGAESAFRSSSVAQSVATAQDVIETASESETETEKAFKGIESKKIKFHEWDAKKILQLLKENQPHFFFQYKNFLCVIIEEAVYAVSHQQHHLDFTGHKWSGFDLKQIWTDLHIDPNTLTLASAEWDLMLGAYVLKSNDSSNLAKLAKSFLNIEIDDPRLSSRSKDTQICFEIPKKEIIELAQTIEALNQIVRSELQSKEMEIVYQKLERPVIPILFQMEQNGITLDISLLQNFSKQLTEDIQSQEKKIQHLTGEKFNIASPKQLGVILFEKLKLDVIKKTKTGYSTDNEVLEKLDHPVAKEVISYRELSKLKSTYVDALPALADSQHRVHTHFNQALTATGRLSSTDPNLQNIPIKTEKGQIVRKAFIAEVGKKLLSVDYSQIELRVLAHISEDPGLIKAFQEDHDIHTATASEIFSVKLNLVSKDQRRIAKAVNFGIAYGQGVYGLAETLSIPRTEAAEIIERYFQKFKGIRGYIETTIQKAHQQKYVETLFGRRRYIPELDSKNVMIKKFGERAAINAPIQGTASDLVKMAMIELSSELKLNMLLQVHDELVFEGTIEQIENQKNWIKKTMENVARLRVPLKVNMAIGHNWDEAH